MDFEYYYKIFYRRIWLVLLLPVIATAVAALLSFYVIVPEYESNATLYILNKDGDSVIPLTSDGILASQQLVRDYGEIIKSRSVLGSLIEKLKLNIDNPDELAGRINISLKNETRVIEISARSTDPEEAVLLAENVTCIFIDKLSHLICRENIEIVDSPIAPDYPVKPKPVINMVIAAIIGLIAAFGTVMLLESMDKTIKSIEDVETQLNLAVLGTIPSLDIK